MTIQTAIASHLIHDSKVALEVDDRVFHLTADRRRHCPMPYITYQIISQNRVRYMTNVCGLLASSVQINIWARTDTKAYDIAEAIRQGLDKKNHTDIGRAPNTIEVRDCILQNSFANYDPPDGEEDGVFHYVQEWEIWHTESLPALAV